MLTTVSIILIILSCLVIFFIISKKFPALAVLDVESLPEEKEAKFKEQIMRQRLERDLSRFGGFFFRIWKIGQVFGGWLRRIYDRLKEIKLGHANRKMSFKEKQERIEQLLSEANFEIGEEQYQSAEAKLISVISLDDKDLRAFIELADVYSRLKKLAEAKQTYRYALKLMRQHKNDEEFLRGFLIQEVYFSLAWVEKDMGEVAAALDCVRDALEFEPNNPRYLDLILDLGIMKKDKKLCEDSLARLSEVNPENKKISEWREKIDELPF